MKPDDLEWDVYQSLDTIVGSVVPPTTILEVHRDGYKRTVDKVVEPRRRYTDALKAAKDSL